MFLLLAQPFVWCCGLDWTGGDCMVLHSYITNQIYSMFTSLPANRFYVNKNKNNFHSILNASWTYSKMWWIMAETKSIFFSHSWEVFILMFDQWLLCAHTHRNYEIRRTRWRASNVSSLYNFTISGLNNDNASLTDKSVLLLFLKPKILVLLCFTFLWNSSSWPLQEICVGFGDVQD